MVAVPEGQRIAALRRLGASDPLIRLSSGECVHPTFRNSCLGPPYYVYHRAELPDGQPLVAASGALAAPGQHEERQDQRQRHVVR